MIKHITFIINTYFCINKWDEGARSDNNNSNNDNVAIPNPKIDIQYNDAMT